MTEETVALCERMGWRTDGKEAWAVLISLREAYARGRKDGIEEAAGVLDARPLDRSEWPASRIRSLIAPEEQTG